MILEHPQFGQLLVPDSAHPAGFMWIVCVEKAEDGSVVVRARRFLRSVCTWTPTGRTEMRMVQVARERWDDNWEEFRLDGGKTEDVMRLHYECVPTAIRPWIPVHSSDVRGVLFKGPVWIIDPKRLNKEIFRQEVLDLPSAHVRVESGSPHFAATCREVVIAHGWDDAV